MATHDYNIANQTGANFRADLNNALSAILSNNASATEPTTTTAYMLWVDTGNNLLKMRNSSDDGWVTLPVSITTSNTVDIDGGTVNTITSLSFSSGETVTTILDEDDLSSDSASALATQQSIKAYVDSQVTAQDLDFQGDTGGALSIDLDSETFTISGGNGIDTSGALNTLTIAIDSSVVTLTDTQTLTNKTIDADSNTISNLELDNLKSGVLDTDLSDVSASDDTIASAKAIKTYVDSQVTAQDLDFQADSGGVLSIDLDSETFTINGGTGIDTVGSENTVQINIDSTVATLSDTQTLTNKTIDADNNTVSNLEVDNLKSGVLDTDLTSVSASDDTLASAKAIKTYVDAQVTAQDLDLTDGTTSISIDLDSETLSVLGGTGVTSTASGNGVTLAIGQDVGTTADVTFNTVSADLTGDVTGNVTGTVSSIANHTTTDLTEGTNLYYTTARFDSAFSGKSTSDLTEGTNLYYTTARFDSAFSGKSTSNLTEGTNLYYTDARFDTRLATKDTDDLTEGVSNLYFTTARVDSHLSGGTGVTYSSGTISIGQAVSTTSDVTFNDVVVSGDLTVSGTTTTINTETINLADNIILFNSNATGTPTENAGIEIERGDAANKTLIWDETNDKWTVGSETFVAATFEGALTGNVTGTVSSLSNHNTGDLAEGSNLYYTTARFDSAFSGKTTSDLTEGTNLYYTTARFDTAFSGKDTDDLTEGATNLYYTTARANSDFDTRLATKSTSDLSEGTNLYYTDSRFDTRLATKTTDNLTEGSTNLYYTDARVDSHLSGGTGVTYSSGVISIGQAVGTTDSVTFAGVTSDFTGDIEGAVKFTAKADVALTKGQVVYISGVSGEVPTVNLADADNSSAMPAFGLVYANANINAEVEIITFGSLTGLDTSAFTVGKTVYVSTTAGALTTTAPTGESSLIQNIGMVQRSHATAGIIKVGGAGRTNATPNLNSGKIFYGNGSNQSVATTLNTSIVPESGNLYYTDTRARSAISVSGNALSYDSGTGVITSNYEESPTFTGTVTVTGEIVANGGIALGDNDKATFGASNDLQIYHDGSHSYIQDAGTGNLKLKGQQVSIESPSGNLNLYCIADGDTRLYYNNSQKLTTTSTGIDVTGNITVSGTVDGRDLATDGTKLDGIESGATADQTASEILTLIKTVDGAGSGLDADLLDGQSSAYYQPASSALTTSTSFGGDVSGTYNAIVVADDSHNHIISNVDGLQTALDAKLNSSSYTAADVLTKIKTVDGAGSGLDADLLDGISSASFLRSDATDTASGALTFTGAVTFDQGTNTTVEITSGDTGTAGLRIRGDTQGTGFVEVGQSSSYGGGMSYNGDNSPAFVSGETADNITFYNLNAGTRTEVFSYPYNSTTVNFNGNITLAGTVDGRDVAADGTKLDGIESGATADQTAAEILTAIKTVDGAGSGLDADLLDGISSASFLRSDAADTFTTLSGTSIQIGSAVTLSESTDRADLLQISSSTTSWAGLQIRNTSNEGRWSFMTDGAVAGIYDDENSDWHIYMTENAGVDLRHNGATKFITTSTGIDVTGKTLTDQLEVVLTNGIPLRFEDIAAAPSLQTAGYIGMSTSAYNGINGDLILYPRTSAASDICLMGTNHGINTHSPSHTLTVEGGTNDGRQLKLYGTSNNALIKFDNADTAQEYSMGLNASAFIVYDDTNSAYRFIINSSGKILAGTTSSPSGGSINMLLAGTTAAGLQLSDTAGNGGGAILNINNSLAFYTHTGGIGSESYSQHMTLNTNGDLLIGKTARTSAVTYGGVYIVGDINAGSTNYYAQVYVEHDSAYNHGIVIDEIASGGSGIAMAFRSGGTVVGTITVTSSATTYNTSSDARLKEVTGSARGLEVINALNPVSYNWKIDGKADEGLIAQEVLEIVPNAVSGSEEEYYQMDYSKLVTHLVAGMKEQQTLIEQLQARLEILENA